MNAPKFSIRESHERLLSELLALEATASSGDVAAKIEVGSVLREVSDAFGVVLDRLKEAIREQALRKSGGRPGTYALSGEECGEASVNIPEATLRLARGQSIEDLRRALGDDFDLFFEEVTTHRPRKDYETRAAALQDTAQRRVLLAAVERVDSTPRVSFRREDPHKVERDDRT